MRFSETNLQVRVVATVGVWSEEGKEQVKALGLK